MYIPWFLESFVKKHCDKIKQYSLRVRSKLAKLSKRMLITLINGRGSSFILKIFRVSMNLLIKVVIL